MRIYVGMGRDVALSFVTYSIQLEQNVVKKKMNSWAIAPLPASKPFGRIHTGQSRFLKN